MFAHLSRGLIALLNRTHLAVAPTRPRRKDKRKWSVQPQLEILPSRIAPAVDFWTGANGATDLNWSDPANWSLGHTPGASDVAYFTSVSNAAYATSFVDQNFTIGGLYIDGNWNPSGVLYGGGIFIGGANNPVTLTLANGSANEWDTGFIFLNNNGSALVNDGTMTLNNTADVNLYGPGTFTNNNAVNLINTGNLDLNSSGGGVALNLNNSSGATINFQNNGGIIWGGNYGNNFRYNDYGGFLNNAGTIEKTGGGSSSTTYVGGGQALSNTGTINAASGTLALGVESGDNLNSGGTIDTNGTFDVASGAILDLNSDINAVSTFTENGTFTASGAGEVVMNEGTLATGLSGATFDIPNTVSFQWTGGSIYVPVGATLTFNGTIDRNSTNTTYIGGGGTFQDNGTLNLVGGGWLGLYGNSANTVATEIINPVGSVIDFQGDLGVFNSGWQGGYITNAGVIEMTASSGTSFINQYLSNTGTISVSSGTFGLDWSDTDTNGTFSVASGAILDLTDSTNNNTFTEDGTFTASGSGEILLDAGALAAGASGATFDVPNTVSFVWTGGAISVPVNETLTYNGTLTQNSAGTVYLVGGGTFTNKGAYNQTNGGYLQLNNGTTLNNPSGSTITFQGDNGITGDGGGFVTNAGTIDKTAGTGTSYIWDPLTNTGTLENAASGTTLGLLYGTTDNNGTLQTATGAIIDLTDENGYAVFAQNGTLTASGSGEILLDAGTLAIGASGATINLPNTVTFAWLGSYLNVPTGATLTLNGNLNLNGSSNEYLEGGGTLLEKGTITQSNTGYLGIIGTGSVATTLDIPTGSVYDFAANSGIYNAGNDGGVVDNAGTIEKTTTSGTAPIDVAFNNTGGAINVSKGTLTLSTNGGLNTGGTFNVSSGAILNLTGGNTVAYSGTYTGTGTGEVELGGGTLSVEGGTNGATFNLPGNLFVWSGGTIDTNGNTMTILGNVKINSTNGGEAVNSGNSSGGYLDIGSSSKTGVLSFTATGNTLNVGSSTTLQISSKGTVNLDDDTINGSGAVANFGSLIKNAGTSTATIATYVDNEKTVEVETGTLNFTGTVNQVSANALTGGTWEVVDAKTAAALSLSGSFATINPGVTVEVSGPFASFANLSSVTTNDGSLSLLGGASVSTTGNFTNDGILTLTGSSTANSVLNVGGTFTQLSGGTLNDNFSGTASAPTYGVINSTGAASLAGTLKVTSKIKPTSNIDIITYGSETGDFAHKTLPTGWSASPGSTDYVLTP